MHLTFRNINESFRGLVELFYNKEIQELNDCYPVRRPYSNPNGSGYTLAIEEPVTITLTHPTERVLFNAARDANPFFHLYESLWMLAGRSDVAPLAYYSKGITKFSDDGKTFNGAYGYRWRHASANCNWDDSVGEFQVHDVDQLDLIVDMFKNVSETRRAVLQMWTVEDDLLKAGCDLAGDKYGSAASKDVCCNLSVMFSVREVSPERTVDQTAGGNHTFKAVSVLDMTVVNRSNDLVWGLCGANAVHFSFLQEYMAARIGVTVGRFHTITNNLHVYDKNNYYKWEPEKWLNLANTDRMQNGEVYPGKFSLVSDPATFDQQLGDFVTHFSGIVRPENLAEEWKEPFLQNVAQPMLLAFACYKEGRHFHDAFTCMYSVEADDWRIAGTEWLKRRMKPNDN